jgi:homoserine dehydrogenase
MRKRPLTVLKFGSSVLRSEADLPAAVHETYRWVRRGHRVIAVVSAIGNTTEELLARSRTFGAGVSDQAVAVLLATGEATSAALLSLALDRAGIPAVILDEVRLGLRTRGPILNSEPCEIDVSAVERALEQVSVVVVPGFVGRREDGTISLLGRGGTDLTAIFVAHQLNADCCRLIKDVDGIFEYDPASRGSAPRRYRTLGWAEAGLVNGGIVQAKAIHFAETHGFAFEVAGLNSDQPSLICGQPEAFYGEQPDSWPLRVGLLGAGTVGLGVYRYLAAQPERFQMTGIGVRCLEREDGTPSELLTPDPWEVVDSDCELVVELIGGLWPAKELIEAALSAGKHVITANKLLISHWGRELHELAARKGVQLLYSGAVGGAVPMLEQVRQIADTHGIRALSGVINGTTNFILDRLAEGVSGGEAVSEAQRLGFAEQDPTADLDGSDAVHKLALLARAGFGGWLHPDDIGRTGIEHLAAEAVQDAARSGLSVRLVATVESGPDGLKAWVEPQFVDRDHIFGQTHNEENCLEIRTGSGEVVHVRGKGAGRWPTAEAVMADVFDVLRIVRAEVARTEITESCLTAGRVS